MEVRIVSLSSWGTQVLLDLDMDHWIAGLSHDALIIAGNPQGIPVVTSPGKYKSGSGNKITLTEILLSKWFVDMDLLRSLKPSHIITEGMLNLSGLTSEEAEKILEQDGLPGCRIIDFYPVTLDDIFESIRMIAGIFGYEDKGGKLILDCQKNLKKTVKKYGIKRSNQHVVAVISKWPSLQLTGRWMSDLIEISGAIPLIYGEDMFITSDIYFEKIPDILIIGKPHSTLEENRKDAGSLDEERLFSIFSWETPPLKFVVDGTVFYDRSCTGLVTTIKILSEIIRKDPKLVERKGIFWDLSG